MHPPPNITTVPVRLFAALAMLREPPFRTIAQSQHAVDREHRGGSAISADIHAAHVELIPGGDHRLVGDGAVIDRNRGVERRKHAGAPVAVIAPVAAFATIPNRLCGGRLGERGKRRSGKQKRPDAERHDRTAGADRHGGTSLKGRQECP